VWQSKPVIHRPAATFLFFILHFSFFFFHFGY